MEPDLAPARWGFGSKNPITTWNEHLSMLIQAWPGQVFAPGEWGGGVMNGGAWLTMEGQRVDVIYRDLDCR